ncbi:hypothetical protein B0J17DRAFT_675580 [Rhizoctonia solani]|nr:hypothetical protein B0J17DRAFT_675580 [Rhizoctonia solani]
MSASEARPMKSAAVILSPVEEQPKDTRHQPEPISPNTTQTPASQGQLIPGVHMDVATKEDIISLRQLIQYEFEQLKLQNSTSPSRPPIEIPKEAFTDALSTEMAMQLAKISALEEETRKLRAEKQDLGNALERVQNQSRLHAELSAANEELRRVYVERQGLWDERADLWKERGELWVERDGLWKERQSLWDEREKLWEERDGLSSVQEKLSQRVNLLEALSESCGNSL